MVQIQAFFAQIGALFVNLFDRPDWRNIVDIGILAVLIYSIIKLVMHTRANSLFKGIIFILVLSWLAEALQISAVSWLLQQVINTGVLVLVIVFQPELRRALDQIGRSKWTRQMFSSQKKQSSGRTEQHVAEIVRALNNMSRKKIGALIVFERSTGLGDVIESGTVVDAEISDPLIENIFEPNTPLHDGAVVVRGDRVIAAACLLRLSDTTGVGRDLGTRHRAGLGVSEISDAKVFIVSEETGIISMAEGGRLVRHLDEASLRQILHGIYDAQDKDARVPLLHFKQRRKDAHDEQQADKKA